jgi:hypothetical protein
MLRRSALNNDKMDGIQAALLIRKNQRGIGIIALIMDGDASNRMKMISTNASINYKEASFNQLNGLKCQA